jgi:O-antigen/teichoic acid export membrane protein
LSTGDQIFSAIPGKNLAANRRFKVVRGSAISLVAYAFGTVLRIGSNIVLASLLFPEAFALVALAAIVTNGLRMFTDIGIGPSIIRSRRATKDVFLNTAWTLQVFRGWGLFLAACISAYPIAIFYETPDLLWVIPASAFPSAISAFNSTSLILANRALQLGRLTALGLCESVIRLGVTVAWAMFDPSVRAILIGSVCCQIFYTVASHVFLPKRQHRFQCDPSSLGELVSFGSWIFLSTALTFLARQTDRIILGKLVTLSALGVYSISYMFSRMSLEVCSSLAGSVLFPALADVAREQPERLKNALRSSRHVMLTLGIAFTLGLIVISPWFFHYLYDERYSDAQWLVPLMCFVAWFSLLQASTDRVLLAVGQTRSLFVSNLLNFATTVVAGISGYYWFGVPGFIAGNAVGNLVGHAVVVIAVWRTGYITLSQDFAFTSILAVMAVVAGWLPSMLTMDLTQLEGQLRAGIQGVLLVSVCLISLRLVWNDLLKK